MYIADILILINLLNSKRERGKNLSILNWLSILFFLLEGKTIHRKKLGYFSSFLNDSET